VVPRSRPFPATHLIVTTETDPSPDATPSPDGSAPLTVRLPVFEGPLDLLLHLIRKHEIDIRDIPIIQIAEQYIEYLNLMKELNLDLAGEYLVMAATLIHIKSKMLLPVEVSEEEEEEQDPRADLVRQLLEYEKFKRAADVLYERERVERASHARGADPEFESEEDVFYEASLFDLVAAFKLLLEERKRVQPFTIEAYTLSVADRTQQLADEIERSGSLGFRDLFRVEASKQEWIVTFLALLELARMGTVRILQRATFGDIVLQRREAKESATESG